MKPESLETGLSLFLAKREELRTWSRDHLEIRLAHCFLQMESMEESGRKSTINIDYLIRQLDRHGADMDEINAEMEKLNQQPHKAVKERWAQSVVGQAKVKIKQEWAAWQQSPDRFKNKLRFIESMQDRHGYPTDTKTGYAWLREWEK